MNITKLIQLDTLHRLFSYCGEICKVGKWPCLVVVNKDWKSAEDCVAAIAWQDYDAGIHHELRIRLPGFERAWFAEGGVLMLKVVDFEQPLALTFFRPTDSEDLARGVLCLDRWRCRAVELHGEN